MNNIKVLDCTLRDGGFVNDWNFGQNVIQNIYHRLISANIDIIELGFLNEAYPFDINRSIMPHSKYLKTIYRNKVEKGPMLVAMVILGECGIENIDDCQDTFVDGIRVVFKKSQIDEAFKFANKVKDKGYEVFLQPASVTDYSEKEMLELIEQVNEFHPYALYIVDTYGLMHKEQVVKYFNLMDSNLLSDISVGFHSHNNFQLSYASSIALLELESEREFIIDASLFGMGKGVGNLNTELITDYLNKNYNKEYELLQILEIIDLEIVKIKEIHSWGYSLNGFIAASNGCHPKYVDYLIKKNTLSIKSVNQILLKLPREKKTTFYLDTIENLYLEFQSKEINDKNSYIQLKEQLEGKNILILATGSSLLKEAEKISEYINNYNPVVILVNHNKVEYPVDYLFISNSKRYNQMVGYLEEVDEIKIIATSNITHANRNIDYMFNYSKLLVEGDSNIVSDNATLMLINMMINMNIESISVAGFDGFSRDYKNNYVDNYLSYNTNQDIDSQNTLIKEAVEKLSERIKINFITKTKYRS